MPVCEGECGGRCLEIKGAQIELVAHLTNEFADEWLAYGVAQGQSHGAMPLHRTRQTIEPRNGSLDGVERAVNGGAGQGATTRNGCSIPRRCNAALCRQNRAIRPVAFTPNG